MDIKSFSAGPARLLAQSSHEQRVSCRHRDVTDVFRAAVMLNALKSIRLFP